MAEKEVEKHKTEIKKLRDKLDFLKIAHPALKSPRTIGQKSADFLTKWAGSWVFILLFLFFIIIWMIVNGYYLVKYNQGGPFDPFPFILLNLALSCLAAIQAPVILMSQNRQTQRDRLRAQYDYAIDRKTEKQVREIKKILINMNRKK